MIKFFRKIRYDLMGENKTGKYLKYASGEIVLVVIGILIALQINNWNQHQILSRKTDTFLLNLKSDLENDYKQINRVIKIQSERFLFLDSILQIPEHNIDSSMDRVVTGRNETFFPLNGNYKSGSEEGLINNLKNEELRLAIINLYEHHYIRLQYNGEINDHRHEQIEWHSRAYIDPNILGLNFIPDALQNPDFLDQLAYLNKFARIYSNRAKSIEVEMKRIIDLIAIELGGEQ
jgi:hypothetical protein